MKGNLIYSEVIFFKSSIKQIVTWPFTSSPFKKKKN